MSYIQLKKMYKIREEIEDAIIFDIRISEILKKIKRIPKSHFGILSLANGQFTREHLIQLYSEVFITSIQDSERIIEKVLLRYSDYLDYIPEPDIRGDLVIQKKSISSLTRKLKSFHRLTSPLLVSFVLTYNCMCQCKYCYVDARKNDTVHSLDTGFALDLIDELKDMGVPSMNITGGEPFLKKEIYIILKKALDADINVNISTKKALSKEDIFELKNTGLKRIQVSLDSLNDIESEYLTGMERFSSKMLNTIQRLIDADFEVMVNSVVTRCNVDNLINLVEHLNGIGVKKHFISPYLKTLGRHDDYLFADKDQYRDLKLFLEEFTGQMKVDFQEPDFEAQINKSIDNIQLCSGGRMGIVILPDGRVTICERLLDDQSLIVGDIKTQSLEEIWNSNKLFKLLEPDRELFKETDCYNCDNFEECILEKGLCYARVKSVYKTIYNKDPLCPKSREADRFV